MNKNINDNSGFQRIRNKPKQRNTFKVELKGISDIWEYSLVGNLGKNIPYIVNDVNNSEKELEKIYLIKEDKEIPIRLH